MNPLEFLPKELEDIIIDYKEQLEYWKKIENKEITTKHFIRQRDVEQIKYCDLYKILTNGEQSLFYEKIHSDDIIKPYIDYENHDYNGNIDEIREEILNKLCLIFKTDKDEWAISSNIREETPYRFANTINRCSFRFVLWTRTMKASELKKIVMEQTEIAYFYKHIDGGFIDRCCYRDVTCLRTPMTSKDIENNTYLKPENYNTYEEFYKHIITLY